MLITVKKEIWDFHCIGTDFTFKYNHKEKFVTLYSESKKEIINTVNIKFKDFEDFRNDCRKILFFTVQEARGLN